VSKLSSSRSIIAVHGLGANPIHTWSARRPSNSARRDAPSHETTPDGDDRDPNRVYWLQEFLPEAFPKARIMAFDHNADWIWNAPTTTAAQSAVQMIQAIRSVREDLEVDVPVRHSVTNLKADAKWPSRPLIFIAHSYGGIIVKQVTSIATKARFDQRVV
jgi:hypothetical protein